MIRSYMIDKPIVEMPDPRAWFAWLDQYGLDPGLMPMPTKIMIDPECRQVSTWYYVIDERENLQLIPGTTWPQEVLHTVQLESTPVPPPDGYASYRDLGYTGGRPT